MPIVRLPFRFKSPIPRLVFNIIPRWFSHLNQLSILEDARLFLHLQERGIADSEMSYSKTCYLPTSSDRFVIAYRQWVEMGNRSPISPLNRRNSGERFCWNDIILTRNIALPNRFKADSISENVRSDRHFLIVDCFTIWHHVSTVTLENVVNSRTDSVYCRDLVGIRSIRESLLRRRISSESESFLRLPETGFLFLIWDKKRPFS